jgi:hypothetical protein
MDGVKVRVVTARGVLKWFDFYAFLECTVLCYTCSHYPTQPDPKELNHLRDDTACKMEKRRKKRTGRKPLDLKDPTDWAMNGAGNRRPKITNRYQDISTRNKTTLKSWLMHLVPSCLSSSLSPDFITDISQFIFHRHFPIHLSFALFCHEKENERACPTLKNVTKTKGGGVSTANDRR